MPTLYDLIPDPAVVLGLEPEELAGHLIEYLNSLPAFNQANLNRYNFNLDDNLQGVFAAFAQPHGQGVDGSVDVVGARRDDHTETRHAGRVDDPLASGSADEGAPPTARLRG